MAFSQLKDYYEILQVSPRADRETIERVFRYLARRYHPDNGDSGNSDRFAELVDAYDVVSDPERRAIYDVDYERAREARWKPWDQASSANDIAADSTIRLGMLSLLYVARRNNVKEPGVGIVELERRLSCMPSVIEFQAWYLRENGWIEKLVSGMWAITASGVDKLFDLGGPGKSGPFLLREGDAPQSAAVGE